jgi:hypothetical protein
MQWCKYTYLIKAIFDHVPESNWSHLIDGVLLIFYGFLKFGRIIEFHPYLLSLFLHFRKVNSLTYRNFMQVWNIWQNYSIVTIIKL